MHSQYLKQSEIRSIVGREDADIQRVIEWMNTHETVTLDSIHPHRDWITVTTTVKNVEKLFSCTLGYVIDDQTGYKKIASTDRKYTIPDSLQDVIEVINPFFSFHSNLMQSYFFSFFFLIRQLVSGLSSASFPRWKAHVVTGTPLAATAAVMPQTIYDTYQSPLTGSHGSRLGSQAVVEFGTSSFLFHVPCIPLSMSFPFFIKQVLWPTSTRRTRRPSSPPTSHRC